MSSCFKKEGCPVKKPDSKGGHPEAASPGWDAIIRECERAYPGQKDPRHYATLIKWSLGGDDPLDGISIYDGGPFWHFVTFGLSELYQKESEDPEVSGYGMELTLRLKKGRYADEEAELLCVCGILQQVARITFTSGELFLPFEYLYTGQKEGVDARRQSAITGFITAPDPCLQPLDTPNGRLIFVELAGVTDSELRAVQDGRISVRDLYRKLPGGVTDYGRPAVL